MHLPSRLVARTTAVVVPLSVPLVVAGAAHADAPTTWEKGGGGLTTLDALLIFVGIPFALVVVIGVLASISSGKTTPRYRPTQKWEAESEWFGAPELEEHQALPEGATDRKPGGGASATW